MGGGVWAAVDEAAGSTKVVVYEPRTTTHLVEHDTSPSLADTYTHANINTNTTVVPPVGFGTLVQREPDPVIDQRNSCLIADDVPEDVLLCDQQPGDIMWTPSWWWHETCALEEYSIGVGAVRRRRRRRVCAPVAIWVLGVVRRCLSGGQQSVGGAVLPLGAALARGGEQCPLLLRQEGGLQVRHRVEVTADDEGGRRRARWRRCARR